ncbi:ParA family protein [Sulfuricurvum sp.]|uniref:ParA family protein n=1 Tax=Sulfuricurvum sp. TaxID=2025608 RepID=UPI002D55EC0C|nr:ParA family protein [Sulfuricurvum sp.]HZF69840.1 ParA family protein [Sulfuricurvum sp.]
MKTITIAHSKGGVSKSTLAWNLAIALRMSGLRVALVDIDGQQVTLEKTSLARTASGYDPFPVIIASSAGELSSIIMKEDYDIVIIDAGGYDYDLGRVAIAIADRIVVPISEESTEVLGFTSFLGTLHTIAEHSPVPAVMIVITRAHARAKSFAGIRSAAALWPSATIAQTVMRRRAVYSASMGHGFGVTELAERHPDAAYEMYRLAREIIYEQY